MCRESPWRMQSAEKASEGAAHDPVLVVSIELVDGGEIACDKVVQGVGMHDETCGEYARWGRVAPVCALAERGDIGVLGEERGACDGEGRIEERECGPLGGHDEVVGLRKSDEGHHATRFFFPAAGEVVFRAEEDFGPDGGSGRCRQESPSISRT